MEVAMFGWHTKTFEEHMKHLREVFDRAGLTLIPKKCFFANYLGHVISRNGISPDPYKTVKVQEFCQPMSLNYASFLAWLCDGIR